MSHEQAVIALLQEELPECRFWWSRGSHSLAAVELDHFGWNIGYLWFREDQAWWEPSLGLAATRTEYADPDCIPQLARAIRVSIARKTELARITAKLHRAGHGHY